MEVAAPKDSPAGSYRVIDLPLYAISLLAEAVAETATEKWDVTDAAWAYGWLIRDGKALTIQDVIKNDGTNYVSDGGVLGLGWNSFYMKRVLVGRTYDNKIAIMVSSGGQDCWDEGYDIYDNVYNPSLNIPVVMPEGQKFYTVEGIKEADVFIGLSAPNLLDEIKSQKSSNIKLHEAIQLQKMVDDINKQKEIAKLYRKQGYDATVTSATGDGGVDIILKKNGERIAVDPNNSDIIYYIITEGY